jgi:hypothetical protein
MSVHPKHFFQLFDDSRTCGPPIKDIAKIAASKHIVIKFIKICQQVQNRFDRFAGLNYPAAFIASA